MEVLVRHLRPRNGIRGGEIVMAHGILHLAILVYSGLDSFQTEVNHLARRRLPLLVCSRLGLTAIDHEQEKAVKSLHHVPSGHVLGEEGEDIHRVAVSRVGEDLHTIQRCRELEEVILDFFRTTNQSLNVLVRRERVTGI